jgi:uncharacterized protein DUF3631
MPYYTASQPRFQNGECESLNLTETQSARAEHQILDEIVTFVLRFVSLSHVQASVIALWVIHTHALEAAYTTPYLSVTSAEKQSGKTRLLEVLNAVVRNPWLTGRASAAVLVRKIDAQCPTLLLDESDAAFGGDREYTEALRGVLNYGHSHDGVTSLCISQGAKITFKDFRVFCPKAIAGIGQLPDTVADRSIPIRMKRRAKGEPVERFRPRLVREESERLRHRIAAWSGRNLPVLRDARPVLPDNLSDRQVDGAEPLLAIADLVGGDWPQRGRAALVALLTGEAAEDQSVGVRLLATIREVFDQQCQTRLATADLINAVCEVDPQWLDFSYGRPLGAAALARVLKRYGISAQRLRFADGRNLRGYERDAFEDAWDRYLPRKLEQVEQGSNDAARRASDDLEQDASVPDAEIQGTSGDMRVVPDVPVHGPDRVGMNGESFDAAVERHGLIASGNGSGPRPFTPPTASDLGFSDSC